MCFSLVSMIDFMDQNLTPFKSRLSKLQSWHQNFSCLVGPNEHFYTRCLLSARTSHGTTFAPRLKAPLIRKQWIHAIRREEGKAFVITERTKVCSLHFRSEDLRKSINGRIYIKEGGVPSKFDWSGPSPKKRKAPTERQPLPAKKQLLAEDNSHRSDQSASVNSEAQETVEMSACEPSTSFEDDTCKTPDLERQIAEQSTKIGELEEKLKQALKTFIIQTLKMREMFRLQRKDVAESSSH